jgi:transcription factor SPN1
MSDVESSPAEALSPELSDEIDNNDDAMSDASDLESQLSEVDEDQFADFDPNAIALAEREAIPIDETTLKLVGVHKRKRADGAALDEDGQRQKKKKEARREKPKRSRKRRDGSEPFSGGEEIEGKRVRKPRPEKERAAGAGERRPKRPEEVDEDTLTPEERELGKSAWACAEE